MSRKQSRHLNDIIKYNDDGLIPVITQCVNTSEVLMMAWMDKVALEETLNTGNMCYWSRSRKQLWRKGESSGQMQKLIEFRIDCDGDTLLAIVEQIGVACHTGRRSCFYYTVSDNYSLSENQSIIIAPEHLYDGKEDK